MSHRKVHSQGSIPFSWEDKPGICKVTHQVCPADIRQHSLKLTSSQSSTPCLSDGAKVSAQDLKIPLPPCPVLLPPRRSISLKGLRWQEDPFLVAYKECTKSVKSDTKPSGASNKAVVSNIRKTKSMFWCKNSCEVKEDNILKFPRLPPLPREKIGVSRQERLELLRASDQDI
ncbi:hypothetical protein FCV25MIE_07197 [Fagus crenata]